MLFRPLARALAKAIWSVGLRPFAPYDRPDRRRDEHDERHADRYADRDDRYDERYDRRDDGLRAITLTGLDRDYRDSGRYSDRGDGPPRPPARGKTMALLGLALAAVLVVGATLAIEAQLAGHGRPTSGNSTGLPGGGTGLGNGTPAPATATTASSSQPKRWTQAGPAYAQRAAIAESAPSRMYACGFQGSNPQTGPISLLASHDAGSTWQTLATPAKGAYCDVRVSTTTPQDVALFASAVCDQESCTSNDPNQLYLSMDGGAHWSAAQLPATNGTPATPSYTFAWAGNTLFILTISQSQPSGHYVAASTNGLTFAWVDQNMTGLPSGASPIAGEFRAIGGKFYVTFTSNNCPNAQPSCIFLVRTSDGGATWTIVTPTYAGHSYSGVGAIRLVAGAPGAPLIARAEQCSCSAGPTLRSTDGGATWTDLPAYPQGYMAEPFSTVEVPDGTVYAALGTTQIGSGPTGIYVLRPGATSWQLVTYPTGDQWWEFMAVSWDASGHPAALWGWSYSNDTVEGVWRQAA